MGRVDLFTEQGGSGPISLGETHIGTDFAEGEPIQIWAKNVGDSYIRRAAIHVEGEAANNVQLAIDQAGSVGVWAAPGESITAYNGKLAPEGQFSFWARGIFSPEDTEGRLPFEFVVETVSGS